MKNLDLFENFGEELNEVGNSVRPRDISYDGENIIMHHNSPEDAETNAYYLGRLVARVEGKEVYIDPERTGWALVKDYLNR